MPMFSRVVITAALLLSSVSAAFAADFERLPVLEGWQQVVYQLDHGESAEVYITREADRRNYDLIHIDLETGLEEVVLRSIPPVIFWRPLVVNAEHVVALTSASVGVELQLLSRKTGRKVAGRTLKDPVIAATIDGSKLRVLQTVEVMTTSESGKFERWNTHTSSAIFDLPTIAFEGEVHGEPVDKWFLPSTSSTRGAMACHRAAITKVDYELSILAAAEIPNLEGFRHLCGWAAVTENGLIYAHLGEWQVGWRVAALDPAMSAPRYITPLRKSAFNAMAIRNGLLFLAQEGPANSQDRFVRVLDAATGRALKTLPIAASEMFFAGDFLVTRFEDRQSLGRRYRIAIYRLDWRALREGDALLEELGQAHDLAQEILADGGSIHDAIAHMEKAPLDSAFASLDRLAPAERRMLARYALWMTLSFGREEQGHELLERLSGSGTTPPISNDTITVARRRAQALSSSPLPAVVDSEAHEGILSQVKLFSRQVRGAPLSDLSQFDGDRLLVAAHNRNMDGKHYVTLEVFDRRTLNWQNSVPLQERDDERQQVISSIALVGEKILVATESRYPSAEEARLFVLDRNTLEIRERLPFANGTLLLSDGRLVLSCRPSRHSCQVVDPTTLEVEDVDFRLGPQPRLRPGPAFSLRNFIAFLQSVESPPNELVGLSRKYALLQIPARNADVGRFLLSDLASRRTQSLKIPHLPGQPSVRVTFSPDGASIMIRQDGTLGIAFSAIDPESGRVRSLVNLQRRPGQRGYVTHAMSDRYLFVGIGPDLAVVDFETGDVVAFEPDFVKPHSPRAKNVRIDGLIVDGNRLLVSPYSGSVQVIDLVRLQQTIEEPSVLAQTQSGLEAALRRLD